MRTVKTTLDEATFDALDREAGRQGCTMADMLRWCIYAGLGRAKLERHAASLEGAAPSSLNPLPQTRDTKAWSN